MTIMEKFEAAGQGGVFRFFDSLDDGAKEALLGQLEQVNLAELGPLLKELVSKISPAEAGIQADTTSASPPCAAGRHNICAAPAPLHLRRAPPSEAGARRARQKRIRVAPHVSPAPNATSSTRSPFLTLPPLTTSSSAIGIEADDVLP